MSLLSSIIRVNYGKIQIRISDGGAAETYRITDLEPSKFEFDVIGTEPTVNNLQVSYSSIKFSAWQYTDNGTNIYDRLRSNITDSVQVTMIIESYEDGILTFEYTLKANGVEIDDLTGIVTLECSPYVPTDINVNAFFTTEVNTSTTVNTIFTDATQPSGFLNVTSLSVGEFIKQGISRINTSAETVYKASPVPSAFTGVMTSNVFEDFTNSDLAGIGNKTAFVVPNRTTDGYSNNVNVTDVLKDFAGVSGSLFGNAFGRNFFVYRLDRTDPVTIGYRQLTELKAVHNPSSYRDMFVSLTKENVTASEPNIPDFTDRSSRFDLNPEASKTLLYTSNGSDLLCVGQINTTVLSVDAFATTNDIETILCNTSVNSYGIAFSTGEAERIEGKIRGVGALKPYECFQFDTDVPARYQGKRYRCTYLYYDWILDIISFKAYAI